jgi:tetratricopeptide (TPR) repeat protein
MRLVFWPRPLVLDYEWPLLTSWSAVPIGSAIMVIGFVVATLAGVWLWPRWSVLGLWFLGILAPTSSVVPLLDAAFEHRMYLPSAASIVAVLVGLTLASDALESRWNAAPKPADKRLSIPIGWAATAILVAVLMYLTDARNLDYRSSLSIWSDNVAKRPDNPRGHFNLSQAMETSGDYAGAIEQMRTAVDLDPDYFDAVEKLGVLLAAHDTPQAAIDYYTRQVAKHPEWDAGWFELGKLQRQQGDLADARVDFLNVIRLVSNTPEADAARLELVEIGR